MDDVPRRRRGVVTESASWHAAREMKSLPRIAALALVVSLAAAACGEVKRPDGGSGLVPIGTSAPDGDSTYQRLMRYNLSQLVGCGW